MAARRQFAERSGSTLRALMSDSTDLVYYAQTEVAYPQQVEVVDYDLSQLEQIDAAVSSCQELNGVVGPRADIVVNVPRFVPLAQSEFDICAASRILSGSGRLSYLMPGRSGHRRIAAVLESAFGRVVRRSSSPHLFTCRSPLGRGLDAPVRLIDHQDPVSGAHLGLETRPGLFSYGKIDDGTQLLLENARISAGMKVLDVGCGYGAVGLVAAVRGASVEMVDCDCRAVALTEANLHRNGLVGTVRLSADLDARGDGSYDLVLSNPPTHGGSTALRRLFAGMVRVCRPHGQVLIVVRENLNYEKWLQELAPVNRVASAVGFKVLRMTRRSPHEGRP